MGSFNRAFTARSIALAIITTTIPAKPAHTQADDFPQQLRRLIQLTNSGHCPEAVELASSVIERARQRAGENDPALANLLNDIGKCQFEVGRYADAEVSLNGALHIVETAFGPDAPQAAVTLHNFGVMYFRLGRFADAEAALTRAMDIREQAMDRARTAAEKRDAARVILNGEYERLIGLYASEGRLHDGEQLANRLIGIAERGYGPRHAWVATIASNFANQFVDWGRDREVEALLKRGIAIYENPSEAPTDPAIRQRSIAVALYNLGDLYLRHGRYEEAAPILRRSVEIRRALLTKKLQFSKGAPDSEGEFAHALVALADAYAGLHRDREAEQLYADAQRTLENRANTDSNDWTSFLSIVRFDTKLGRYTEADALLKRLLSWFDAREARSLDRLALRSGKALALGQLAELYRLTNRTGEAEPLFQSALAGLAAAGWREDAIDERRIGLAKLYQATDRLSQAIELSRRTVGNTIERLRKESEASGPELAILRDYFSTHLALLRQAHADRTIAAEAFATAQWAAQSAASAALGELGVRVAAGTNELASLVRARQDTGGQLLLLEKTLRSAMAKAGDRQSSEETIRRKIEETDVRLRQLDAQLAAQFPEYASLARPAPLEAKQAQMLLKPDEGLLFFFPGETQTHIFALTQSGSEWQAIALGANELESKVAGFRRGLDVGAIDRSDGAIDPAQAGKLFDLGLAHELYATLIGPAEALIRDKRHLIVVPSGALTALPFHLLVTEQPAAAVPGELAGYRDAAWLIKRQAVSVLPSVASLKTLRGFARKDGAGKPLVGFGDPVFDPKEPKEQKVPATGKGAQKVASRGAANVRGYAGFWQGAGIDRAQLTQLPRLPETADELKTVAQQLGAAPSDIHLRADASESTVKRLLLADYRIVYFATHGLVAGDVQGLAEPSLALSQPARPSAADDGLLTASEVAQLKLNADWVVLSACNTIAGDKPGAEALSGLARAFFYAGARALLVSHWAVDSNAATALTTSTFDIIKREPQLGRAEALRRAMLAYMNDGTDPRQAYPALWAPFVVVGEGAAR